MNENVRKILQDSPQLSVKEIEDRNILNFAANESILSNTTTSTLKISEDFKQLFQNLLIQDKEDRNVLNLTANENILSNTASTFLNSIWGHRYHLGTLRDYNSDNFVNKGGLFFRGLSNVYKIEQYAKQLLQDRLLASQCEMRYLSGVHAVLTTIGTLTTANDLIVSLRPEEGGHFATKNIIHYLGRRHEYLEFNIENSCVDINSLKELIQEKRPKMIFLDHGATLFPINIVEIKEVLPDECLFVYDASHVMGLIMGNAFPNPLTQGCHLLQGNTHKSFPGPQKAMALWKDKRMDILTDSLDHAFVSSQHTHHSIALYITAIEMYCFGETYAKKMILNAQYLAKCLIKHGIPVFNTSKGHTSTNILMIECESMDQASEYCKRLNEFNISTNARKIYKKPCIRLGTQEITRKGIQESGIRQLAEIFSTLWKSPTCLKKIKGEVQEIANAHSSINYGFDHLIKES